MIVEVKLPLQTEIILKEFSGRTGKSVEELTEYIVTGFIESNSTADLEKIFYGGENET